MYKEQNLTQAHVDAQSLTTKTYSFQIFQLYSSTDSQKKKERKNSDMIWTGRLGKVCGVTGCLVRRFLQQVFFFLFLEVTTSSAWTK